MCFEVEVVFMRKVRRKRGDNKEEREETILLPEILDRDKGD